MMSDSDLTKSALNEQLKEIISRVEIKFGVWQRKRSNLTLIYYTNNSSSYQNKLMCFVHFLSGLISNTASVIDV